MAIGHQTSGRDFELVGELKGFNLSPHSLLTDKFLCRNRAAAIMVGLLAAIRLERQKVTVATAPSLTGLRT